MFETWLPDESFVSYLQRMGINDEGKPISELVLKEFVCFWLTKTEISKTQEQWHHALAQSYQYALNREKNNAKPRRVTKATTRSIEETATDVNWWGH